MPSRSVWASTSRRQIQLKIEVPVENAGSQAYGKPGGVVFRYYIATDGRREISKGQPSKKLQVRYWVNHVPCLKIRDEDIRAVALSDLIVVVRESIVIVDVDVTTPTDIRVVKVKTFVSDDELGISKPTLFAVPGDPDQLPEVGPPQVGDGLVVVAGI